MASEFGFAARLGGDEFTVVIDSATSIEQIREAGDAAGARLPRATDHRQSRCRAEHQCGRERLPGPWRTPGNAAEAADAALFRAKALGRSQLVIYSPELLGSRVGQVRRRARAAQSVRKGRVRVRLSTRIRSGGSRRRPRRSVTAMAATRR